MPTKPLPTLMREAHRGLHFAVAAAIQIKSAELPEEFREELEGWADELIAVIARFDRLKKGLAL